MGFLSTRGTGSKQPRPLPFDGSPRGAGGVITSSGLPRLLGPEEADLTFTDVRFSKPPGTILKMVLPFQAPFVTGCFLPTVVVVASNEEFRFHFDLHPDKAYLSSPVLGIKSMVLKVACSTHLILDSLDVCHHMWNVKFEKHKKVSVFTNGIHFEYGNIAKSEGSLGSQ